MSAQFTEADRRLLAARSIIADIQFFASSVLI
jgi:hypothetical protein